jgi:hypothetical protein
MMVDPTTMRDSQVSTEQVTVDARYEVAKSTIIVERGNCGV